MDESYGEMAPKNEWKFRYLQAEEIMEMEKTSLIYRKNSGYIR